MLKKSVILLISILLSFLVMGCSEESSPSKVNADEKEVSSKSSSSSKKIEKEESSSSEEALSSSSKRRIDLDEEDDKVDEVSSSSSAAVPDDEPSSSSKKSGGSTSKQEALVSGAMKGSCKPVPSNVSKGEPVSWVYEYASGAVATYVNGFYEWSFEGAIESSKTGRGLYTVDDIVYAEKGYYAASLVVNDTKIECDSVYVGGASVNSCSCEAISSKVDIQKDGGLANWKVSGCESEANIIKYVWQEGVEGNLTEASYHFDAKRQTLAPVVTVYNDDDNYAEVQCDMVTAFDSDSPDYIYNGQGSDYALEFPAGKAIVQVEFTSQYMCTLACRNDAMTDVEVTINGKSMPVRGFSSMYLDESVCVAGSSFELETTGPVECHFF